MVMAIFPTQILKSKISTNDKRSRAFWTWISGLNQL